MATLLTDSQVLALENEYTLGSVWEDATDAEKVSAANTAEAVWRTFEWIVNPFDNAATFAEIRYLFAASCRFVVENDGSLSAVNTQTRDLLRRYLHTEPGQGTAKSRPLGVNTSTSTNTSGSSSTPLTGSQIAALLDAAIGTGWREVGATDFWELTGTVAGNQIPDDVLVRRMFGDSAVGSVELGLHSVTTTKVADHAITEEKLGQAVVDQLGGSGGGLRGDGLITEIDETLGTDSWQLSPSTFTMVADQAAAEAMPNDNNVFYFWTE